MPSHYIFKECYHAHVYKHFPVTSGYTMLTFCYGVSLCLPVLTRDIAYDMSLLKWNYCCCYGELIFLSLWCECGSVQVTSWRSCTNSL